MQIREVLKKKGIAMMVKCKLVLNNLTESLCGKDICCLFCNEVDTCKQSCVYLVCKEMLEFPDELEQKYIANDALAVKEALEGRKTK